MADIIVVRVENPSVVNSAHRVFVTIELEKAWNDVIREPYVLICMRAMIPVMEGTEKKSVNVSLYEQYKVEEISKTKKVEMEFEIKEDIDGSREAKATAEVLSYSKQ